jgi:hypothetical protein
VPLKKKIAKYLRFGGRGFGYIAFYCHDVANLLDPQQSLIQKLHEMMGITHAPPPKKENVN